MSANRLADILKSDPESLGWNDRTGGDGWDGSSPWTLTDQEVLDSGNARNQPEDMDVNWAGFLDELFRTNPKNARNIATRFLNEAEAIRDSDALVNTWLTLIENGGNFNPGGRWFRTIVTQLREATNSLTTQNGNALIGVAGTRQTIWQRYLGKTPKLDDIRHVRVAHLGGP